MIKDDDILIRSKENLDSYLCMNSEYGYWGNLNDPNILKFHNLEELDLFSKLHVETPFVYGKPIIDVLVESGLAQSRTKARTLINQKAVKFYPYSEMD